MIQEINAKSILTHIKQPDDWFGLKYNMNLYRGCQHGCIYCDSRSKCYKIDKFDEDIIVKFNAPELLKNELPRKRTKGTIGTGSMNDPYMPIEAELKLMERSLEIIAENRFPIHILTKSDLVLRDIKLIQKINLVFAAVSFSITTADDLLGKKIEPRATLVSKRIRALDMLAAYGITTGLYLMPVLPFIEDNIENITKIIKLANACGVKFIVPAFGMTLRDYQRDYYYKKLDTLFPGLKERYQSTYNEQYSCESLLKTDLEKAFYDLCGEYGIATKVIIYNPHDNTQLNLF
ncbi:MAG: radical SAM protein [Candidatus Margulisbacteria bacterium GWF2_35_9]|nr:MAG: radical SAM protein [Candidatus Margulisbacteria bacterium GWF2_35_9]